MENVLFLSDVLDTKPFKKGAMNIVVAPCGSGKTTAAINRIASLASNSKKALYLIDTRNGCARLSREPKLTLPTLWYDEEIGKKFLIEAPPDDKVVVTTYAQFGIWCQGHQNFTDNFEVIICDEIHNLVQFAAFSEENSHIDARNNLCAAVYREKTLIVGITATPDFLRNLHCPKNFIKVDNPRLNRYHNLKTEPYSNVNNVFEKISPHQRGGLYVARISQIKQFEDIARAHGHNPISIWSLSNKEYPMTSEQLRVRECILANETVPDEYDLFIFNASGETAINIRSHMDYFIVHNSNPTHIEQSRGRYRDNLDTLYLYDVQNGAIVVPDKFLGHPLIGEEKEALREALGIKTPKGRYLQWDAIKQRLIDCGYTYSESREKDKHYLQIEKL